MSVHFCDWAQVQGQPINIGIYVDQTYDIGRIENAHFNPVCFFFPRDCVYS